MRIVKTLMRIEARIHLPDRDEASDQQRRPDQQHHSQRHLGGHQQRPRLVVPQARAAAIAALLQRAAQIRARRLQRGNQSKQMPVRIDKASVNPKTRQSRPTLEPPAPMRGMLPGLRLRMARMPA